MKQKPGFGLVGCYYLFKKLGITRRLECPCLFHYKVEPIGDFRKPFDAACAAVAFKESYLTIFVDLLFGISFELMSKRLLL